jgi:hypothetical protein
MSLPFKLIVAIANTPVNKPIFSWLEKVSKNLTDSGQIGRQIDHQIRFLERAFWGRRSRIL